MERKIYNSQSICLSTAVPVLATREVAYEIIYCLVWELSLKAEWDEKHRTSGCIKDSVVVYVLPSTGNFDSMWSVEPELFFG